MENIPIDKLREEAKTTRPSCPAFASPREWVVAARTDLSTVPRFVVGEKPYIAARFYCMHVRLEPC